VYTIATADSRTPLQTNSRRWRSRSSGPRLVAQGGEALAANAVAGLVRVTASEPFCSSEAQVPLAAALPVLAWFAVLAFARDLVAVGRL